MHFKTIFKSLKNKDMLKRILIILGILIAYRVLAHIPVPLGDPVTSKKPSSALLSSLTSAASLISSLAGIDGFFPLFSSVFHPTLPPRLSFN